jgi:hypothetical protein
VRVPRFVVTEIDLYESDTGFDELSGHEQRPAEGVAAIAVLQAIAGGMNIQCMMYAAVKQQRDGRFAVLIVAELFGGGIKSSSLGFYGSQEFESGVELVAKEVTGEFEPGSLVAISGGCFVTALPLEAVLRKGSVDVVCIAVLTGFDKPRFGTRTERPGKLSGNGSACDMDELFREHGGGGKIVAAAGAVL